MKLIELHILQSFPVSCLNRDDVGAPKSAIFGGATRARISSQCLKRAIRELARTEYPNGRFTGIRTKLLVGQLQKILTEQHKVPADRALEMACAVAGTLNKKEGVPLPTENPEMDTLFFASPAQINTMAGLAFKEFGLSGDIKADKKKFVKACLEIGIYDAADIALFGRMVAADSSLTLEGAAMFSHALSTHKVSNDIDFFATVDEAKDMSEDAGAGMIGTLEFTSATYYRYTALNLDLLWREDHLGALSPDERRQVVDTFLRSTVMAVPGARKSSMNANTLPGYVLGIVKDKGQPIQLVNAFEKSVLPKGGLFDVSRDAMLEHYRKLKEIWGLPAVLEIAVPDVNLDTFCKEILKHV